MKKIIVTSAGADELRASSQLTDVLARHDRHIMAAGNNNSDISARHLHDIINPSEVIPPPAGPGEGIFDDTFDITFN